MKKKNLIHVVFCTLNLLFLGAPVIVIAQKTNEPKLNGSLSNISSGLYPKISTPTKNLVTVDLKNDSIDAQIAVCVLQGIVNRSSTTKLYVVNAYCQDNRGAWKNDTVTGYPQQAQMAESWLKEIFNDIPQRKLPLKKEMPNPGLRASLDEFGPLVKGIIIYDDSLKEATIEAATTIAGQTNGVVVSPALATQLADYHFSVIQDLRLFKFKNNISCLQWLKLHYFKNANKKVAFTWSHMTTDKTSWGAANKDYVVANRLFTYYLNIRDKEESKAYSSILSEYPAGTPVMGWTDEIFADKLFASQGYFMVPYISVENLSVHSSFAAVSGKQTGPKVLPISNNAVYIAFHVPDGDNLLHSMVYEPYTILNSLNFGKIPLTWIINPALVDLAPSAYKWLLKKSGSSNQELGAMLGDGSPLSDKYEGFSFYTALTKYYLSQSGIMTLKQMAEGEAVAWNVQPYMLNSGYAGTDSRGLGPYEYHLDNASFHIGSLHIKEHDLNKIIQSAPVGQPLFLSVFAGTAAGDVCSAVKSFCDELVSRNDGKQYYFVRSMDLAATYRAWKSSQK